MNEPATLDELGKLLVKAIQMLTPEQCKKIADTLLHSLRQPVGSNR